VRQLEDRTVGTIAIGDREVRRLGFGAMRISGARDADGVRSREAAIALTRRTYDRGVNFIDTANIYGYGESEQIIREALHPYPEDLLIATKAGFKPGKILPGHHMLPPDGDPARILAECDQSLSRLKADVIDLFQIHTPDPAIPWTDTVGAAAELLQAGKIRHIGLCNVTGAQLDLALSIAPIVSVQNRYNAADRTYEDLVGRCDADGIVFLPWQPIDLRAGAARREVEAIAAERGVPSRHIALAWVLRRTPMMLPIPGTSKIVHLDENLDAAWTTISDEEYGRIDRTSGL
jgi:aryl-alcohol dehydrogenase-like predicted oxidoreductase